MLRGIEHAAARDRSTARLGPWTLDIDLLIYGTLIDPLLKLPPETHREKPELHKDRLLFPEQWNY